MASHTSHAPLRDTCDGGGKLIKLTCHLSDPCTGKRAGRQKRMANAARIAIEQEPSSCLLVTNIPALNATTKCSCVIVNQEWILTAGHCVVDALKR
jgi:Trypsin